MRAVSLEDIRVTTLKQISTLGGDVMQAVKASEPEFVGFGEVYFSWVDPQAIKAWKYHQCMTLNLVVPFGAVRFVFHQPTETKRFRIEEIGDARYVRLTVPPGIWFGFQGVSASRSLVMNMADIEHDPDEALQKTIAEIEYSWSR